MASLSKSMLDAFVDAFVQESRKVELAEFSRQDIARKVFPGNSATNAKSRLWECCSPRNRRPLDEATLIEILLALRMLLRGQYEAVGVPNAESVAHQFEIATCRRLHIGHGRKATADDFRFDFLLETAKSADDFALPDLVERREFDFAVDLPFVQTRSIEVLQEVSRQIGLIGDQHRRLQLLQIAVSIALLNHPGTYWHDTAFNLVLQAASNAELPLLTQGYGIPQGIRKLATRIEIRLYQCRLCPSLDSPTNYTHSAIRGRRIPTKVWTSIQPFVENSIVSARDQVEIDPTDEFAIRTRSATTSMKARLLAVTGGSADLREADKLQKDSLRDSDRLSSPYGFAYPILKDIVQSKLKAAIRKCEDAVAVNENAGCRESAAAFAALLVQLTNVNGTGTTCDTHYRTLAAEALANPAVWYKCSHIFDADSLRRTLSDGATESSK